MSESYTLVCPLTLLPYTPSWARVEVLDDERYVQSACRWCDAKGHPRTDRNFDPSQPQIHTHILRKSE